VVQRRLGKTEESQDALQRALEVEEPFHDLHRIGMWYLGLATAAAARGQFEQAVEQAAQAHAVFGAIAHKRRLAEIHQRLGEAESGVGRWAEAQQHYQWSASLHTVVGHWEGTAQALGGFAQALLERASPEAARAMGETVLNLLPVEGDRLTQAQALRSRGSICRTLGRMDEARAALEESLGLFEALHRTRDVPLVRQELVLLAIETRDLSEAHRHFKILLDTAGGSPPSCELIFQLL